VLSRPRRGHHAGGAANRHAERTGRLSADDTARKREFREAHRLFLEIAAVIRAEQVAKELGA
jgi:hypothetical protein